jgi:hypothetical protein
LALRSEALLVGRTSQAVERDSLQLFGFKNASSVSFARTPFVLEPRTVVTSVKVYSHGMKGSATVQVDASPQRVWTLVSDVTNTGRFSPETFEAEWLGGATRPAMGVRFRGHVRRNGKNWLVYWTQCTITKCEPGREFAFEVKGPRGRPSVIWSYHFEPVGDGTNVTERFELGESLAMRFYAAIAGKSRTQTNISNMRATLERIKAVAESPEQGG